MTSVRPYLLRAYQSKSTSAPKPYILFLLLPAQDDKVCQEYLSCHSSLLGETMDRSWGRSFINAGDFSGYLSLEVVQELRDILNSGYRYRHYVFTSPDVLEEEVKAVKETLAETVSLNLQPCVQLMAEEVFPFGEN